MPQYPYGDSSAGVTGQGPVPQPRALEDTWGPHSGYGAQPRYAWSASGHSSLYVSDSHPSWTSSGAASHPPTWESQGQVRSCVHAEDLNPWLRFHKVLEGQDVLGWVLKWV